MFVVDAYTRRIGQRVGLFSTNDYQEIQMLFHRELAQGHSLARAGLYNEYHALLVELGKVYCNVEVGDEWFAANARCRGTGGDGDTGD